MPVIEMHAWRQKNIEKPNEMEREVMNVHAWVTWRDKERG